MHPLRFDLHNELHARPSIYFNEPAHVFHLTLVESDGVLGSIIKRLDPQSASQPQGVLKLDGHSAKWERHTEFLSLTLVVPKSAEDASWPEIPDALRSIVKGNESLIVEASVILVESESSWSGCPNSYGFKDASGSEVGAGDAVVWSDFRLTPDGINRILFINRALNAYRLGRMIRRLLEIETYRTMAALALPVAKDVTSSLTSFERELTRLSDQNAKGSGANTKATLDDISRLSAQIVRSAARTRQRFSATEAYAQIVFERIGELREKHVPGCQRLGVFIERRFRPTVRYCYATHQRLERLNDSVANLSDLLQARVQVEVEEQNAAILKSLNERSATQVKIQKAVEGLSIIAISYYFLSLCKLVYEGLHGIGVEISPRDTAIYLAPPAFAILLTIALRIRRAQRD